MAQTTTDTTTTTTTTTTVTTMKKNSKKKKYKKKFINNRAEIDKSPILSQDELLRHVSERYIDRRCKFVFEQKEPKQQEQEKNNRQQPSLSNLDRFPSLVLNADYQPMSHLPLSLWHWQEAVKAVFNGKCVVVDVYPDITIRTVNLDIPLPSVIALNEYVTPIYHRRTSNKNHMTPAFTKRNVFLRDGYRCQYCDNMFHTRDLSLDHVKPRCMGGRLTWENAVTSCKKCNGRKGCKEVKDLKLIGMKLLREPYAPTPYQLAMLADKMLPRKNIHPTWEPYLALPSQKEGEE